MSEHYQSLKKEYDFSDTFCVLPWLEVGLVPVGEARVCAWALSPLMKDLEKKIPFSVRKDSIKEVLSSDHLKRIKESMLKGESIDFCKRCYEMEAVGNKSKRLTQLDRYEDQIQPILSEEVQTPEILELRLGNLCNLGCITCNSYSSSFMNKEYKKHSQDFSNYDKVFERASHKLEVAPMDWYKNEAFWEDVYEILPNIKRIYLAGGEPCLVKEAWSFLGKLAEASWSKEIQFEMSTNMTALKSRHINILKSFKDVNIFCSIDAIGEPNEYIRYPTRWETVEKNFSNLLESSGENFHIKIMPAISIFNVWHLYDIYQWTKNFETKFKREIPVYCHTLVRDPAYHSLVNLPPSIKESAIEELNRCIKDFPSSFNHYQLTKVIKFIENSQGDTDIFKRGQMFVENFDKIRNNSWKKVVPQLQEGWL